MSSLTEWLGKNKVSAVKWGLTGATVIGFLALFAPIILTAFEALYAALVLGAVTMVLFFALPVIFRLLAIWAFKVDQALDEEYPVETMELDAEAWKSDIESMKRDISKQEGLVERAVATLEENKAVLPPEAAEGFQNGIEDLRAYISEQAEERKKQDVP